MTIGTSPSAPSAAALTAGPTSPSRRPPCSTASLPRPGPTPPSPHPWLFQAPASSLGQEQQGAPRLCSQQDCPLALTPRVSSPSSPSTPRPTPHAHGRRNPHHLAAMRPTSEDAPLPARLTTRPSGAASITSSRLQTSPCAPLPCHNPPPTRPSADGGFGRRPPADEADGFWERGPRAAAFGRPAGPSPLYSMSTSLRSSAPAV